ncbi:MAG: Lpg1974 family pore-forming outer membrane protein [Waddliaceae bacterium]
MKIWSRQAALIAFSAWLCLFTLPSAKVWGYDGDASYCSSWSFCDPCTFGGLEVGGEFIWWKPCLDHLEYAVIFDLPGIEKRKVRHKTLCPSWEPGGRVWVYAPSIFCGCCGLSASWTGIYSRDSASTSVPEFSDKRIIVPPLGDALTGIVDEVEACWRVHYYDYDVLAAFPCRFGNCSIFRPFFGFAGLTLEQKLHLEVEAEEAGSDVKHDIKWKSNLYAFGLRVGAEYECKVANGLSLFGKCSTSVLTGEPDTKNVQVGEFPSEQKSVLKVSENECYRVYPGYHLSAGAIYHCCIFDADFALRLGYEFVEWHNLPHHRRFIRGDPRQGTGSTDRTFGWQGLLVGGSITF